MDDWEKFNETLLPEKKISIFTILYHTTKFFTEHLLAIEMIKNRDTYE